MRKFLSDLGLSTIIKVITIGINVVIGVMITRGLGVAGRGEYAIFMVNVSLSTLVLNYGIPEYMIIRYGKSKIHSTTQFIFGYTISLWLSIVAGTVLFIYPGKFGMSNYGLISFIVIVASLETYITHYRHYCLGIKRFDLYNYNFLFQSITFLIIITTLLLNEMLSFRMIPYALIGSKLLTIGLSFINLYRMGIKSFKVSALLQHTKETCAGSFKFFISGIIVFLNQKLIYYIILAKLSKYSLGLYAVAEIFPNLLVNITSQISLVLYPYVAHDNSNSDSLSMISIQIGSLVVLAAFIFLLFTGGFLLPLIYGADYIASYQTMLILIVSSLFLILNGIIVNYFIGNNITKYLIRAPIIGMLSLVFLILMFFNNTIISGSLIVTSSNVIVFLYLFVHYRQTTKFPLSRFLEFRLL
jgi:O-antigen/teichoic acid export membrane protein